MSRGFPPVRSGFAILLAAASVGSMFLARPARATEPAKVDYERDVAPLLKARCGACHGPDKQQGGLRLDVRESALAGGDSGEPAITPGDAAKSPLLDRITSPDELLRMPPEGDRLPAGEVELLRRWIASGADWPASSVAPVKQELRVLDSDRRHWAYRPLAAIEPPRVNDESWPRTPVDRFVRAKQEAAGLAPTPEADRRTLARRAYFDLHGLPPTPEQIDAFVNDDRPDAWERLIDELLASPRYGERWGRHWLDVARYADSNGYERDADRPFAYQYRDFVIRAFNDDLPYDVFLRWQLAGDELAPHHPDALAASGFVGLGPTVASDTKLEEEQRRYRADELDDVVGTTIQATLALTIACARCHDHKYDAIPTRDYYRLTAAFAGFERRDRELPKAGDDEPSRGKALTVADRAATPEPTWLLVRGDAMKRGDPVALGFLTVLTGEKSPEAFLAECAANAGEKPATTHQRSAVAAWLTDVRDGAGALAARVAVNRIWLHHFGEGLVRTPGDFGVRGERPSHPELLDWLAARVAADGWSVKRLHRLIMSSSVYRQGIAFDERKAAVDPENTLWWRRRPRRLEAEALRDAMLASAGVLNLATHGPGVKPPIPPELNTAYNQKDPYPKDAVDDASTRRRSVYLFVKRTLRQPLIETFDGADPSVACPRRVPTTVAPQALSLLNDPLVRNWAGEFAARLARDANDPDFSEADSLVERAYRLALSRGPNERERGKGVEFLRARAAARKDRGADEYEARRLACVDFCQALFTLNEFLYVD